MARMVVYGSSIPCPDMARFGWWLERHTVDRAVMLDIHMDPEAYQKVITWTGHASVPTLVIAPDDGLNPIRPPAPLAGRSARGFDRGTMLTEPNPPQITAFLRSNGIEVVEIGKNQGRLRGASEDPTRASHRVATSDAPATARKVVTVYPITGRQLFFHVPHSWCQECNLTVRAVQDAIEGRDDIELRMKPWWNHLFDALRRGGWHAPVVTIDGKLFSQGVVPDADRLRDALGLAPRVT